MSRTAGEHTSENEMPVARKVAYWITISLLGIYVAYNTIASLIIALGGR